MVFTTVMKERISMKSILVIGSTGKQGNAVVKQLLSDGWHVRALTRNKNN